MDGTVSDFGEFDECLDVTFPREAPLFADEEAEPVTVGKYCMLRLNAPLPPRSDKVKINRPIISFKGTELEGTILDQMSGRLNQMFTLKGLRFGICLPSTCSAHEIETVINKGKHNKLLIVMTIMVTKFLTAVVSPMLRTNVTLGPDRFCDSKLDKVVFNNYQIVSLAIFAIVLSLAALGTLYDLATRSIFDELDLAEQQSKSGMSRFLTGFSIIENTIKLIHVREDREETLSCVHGMRVLSMFWIIIGHTYCFGGFYKILYTFKRLAVDSMNNPARWEYQPLINTYLLVDTFFFLG